MNRCYFLGTQKDLFSDLCVNVLVYFKISKIGATWQKKHLFRKKNSKSDLAVDKL